MLRNSFQKTKMEQFNCEMYIKKYIIAFVID